MKTSDQTKVHSDRYSPEAVRWFASLVALRWLTCAANGLPLRDERLAVACAPVGTAELEFIGRQPFGFAFTQGHQATFNVPSGHRFVIEHVNISCWAENQCLFVQLVTKSPHMFRNLTLSNWPEELNGRDGCCASFVTPIDIQGLTTNTVLFSKGELRNSSTVPPDTYVQIWGYLEPNSFSDVS